MALIGPQIKVTVLIFQPVPHPPPVGLSFVSSIMLRGPTGHFPFDKMAEIKRKVCLIVIDGWGISEETEGSYKSLF